MHVRRTDKLKAEAAFHSLEEYMVHVAEYYDVLEKRQKVDKRRIYLATDDASLFKEATLKYDLYLLQSIFIFENIKDIATLKYYMIHFF